MSRERLPSLRWAAGGLFIAGILAKLLGVVRQVLIAGYFGTSAELDAVFLGVALPMALTVGVGSGFARAAVPVAAAMEKSRFAGLLRHVVRRMTLILTPIMIVMALTAFAWAPLLSIGNNITAHQVLITSALLASFTLLGGTLAGFTIGMVNSQGRHITASLNPIAYNVTSIGAIILLHRQIGALSVLVGICLAEWIQLGVQWPFLWRMTAHVRPRSEPEDWRRLRALFWPSAIMGAAAGLNVVVDRMFATHLPSGSISALTYADALMNLPVGLLGSALSVPLFTRMSHFQNKGRSKDFKGTLMLGIRLFLFIGMPLAVVLTGLCEPIVGVLFDHGVFTNAGVQLSSVAMRGYAAGIAFQALTSLLVSAGLTLKRPWLIVAVILGTTGLNAVLDYYFVQWLGLFGIAVATSIVAGVRVVAMLLVIAPSILVSGPMWRSLGRVCLFALALAVPFGALSVAIDLFSLDSFAARIAMLIVGGIVALGVTGYLWKPLLKREWRSIEKLRRSAAQSIEVAAS